MNPVIWPWLVEIALMTWRSMSGKHYAVSISGIGSNTRAGLVTSINDGIKRPPLPSEILSTVIVYGAFSIIAENEGGRQVGTLLAWGVTAASALLLLGGSGSEATISNPSNAPFANAPNNPTAFSNPAFPSFISGAGGPSGGIFTRGGGT